MTYEIHIVCFRIKCKGIVVTPNSNAKEKEICLKRDFPETRTILIKTEKMKEFIRNNSGSFSEEVITLTNRRGYNKATFCERTMLSEKTYYRIWSNQVRSLPRPETVMQICIGLELGIEYGEPLFEKAGYKLDGCDLLLAYRIILLMCEGIDIHQCNDILTHLRLPLLAKHLTAR